MIHSSSLLSGLEDSLQEAALGPHLAAFLAFSLPQLPLQGTGSDRGTASDRGTRSEQSYLGWGLELPLLPAPWAPALKGRHSPWGSQSRQSSLEQASDLRGRETGQ